MEHYGMKKYCFGDIILGIPSEIGPRVLFLSSAESPEKNMFGVLPEAGVETSEGFWSIFGGHRLWTSPEASPRSYSSDCGPVRVEEGDGFLRLTGPPEIENSVQKQIEITAEGRGAKVLHRIKNTGRWPIKAACWALSVMAPGGFAVVPAKPVEAGGGGLLPDRPMALWPYTKLSDSRLIFDGDYIFIRQRPEIAGPVKIGIRANPSWAAYCSGGSAFVKKFIPAEGGYPDYGCSVEVYSCGDFLELETLGPLQLIEPGCLAEHVEFWSITPAGDISPEAEKVESALGGM